MDLKSKKCICSAFNIKPLRKWNSFSWLFFLNEVVSSIAFEFRLIWFNCFLSCSNIHASLSEFFKHSWLAQCNKLIMIIAHSPCTGFFNRNIHQYLHKIGHQGPGASISSARPFSRCDFFWNFPSKHKSWIEETN